MPRPSYDAQMASKGLTECWRDAMAAKPSTWKLTGVAGGTREVDLKVHSAEEWCAWARGPDKSGWRDAAADPGCAARAHGEAQGAWRLRDSFCVPGCGYGAAPQYRTQYFPGCRRRWSLNTVVVAVRAGLFARAR